MRKKAKAKYTYLLDTRSYVIFGMIAYRIGNRGVGQGEAVWIREAKINVGIADKAN